MNRDGKSALFPIFWGTSPYFTATGVVLAMGGAWISRYLVEFQEGERAAPLEGHYMHDFPSDPGSGGSAAHGAALIQVMDLQHSLLKYQTQQFFTAFTLEFMAQGGDLRTRRGIIALFSSRGGKFMGFFSRSLFGKVSCRHGPRAERGRVWQGTRVAGSPRGAHTCRCHTCPGPRGGGSTSRSPREWESSSWTTKSSQGAPAPGGTAKVFGVSACRAGRTCP